MIDVNPSVEDITPTREGQVLIVEDQESLRRAISTIFRKLQRELILAENGKVAYDILEDPKNHIDLVVSDWMMPEMDGFALLKAMRESAQHKDLPFLMLTAKQTEEALLEALSSGANDFIAKPFKAGELLVRSQNLLRQYMELKALREQTLRDSMTGLYNHKFFQQELEKEVGRSKRYGHEMALMMFDLDHFKKLNDSFGHQAGDVVIKKTAELITKTLRTSDIICRYGGEEFSVILPSTPFVYAVKLADRLREMYANCEYIYDAQPISVTCSFGVAKLEPDDTAASMLKRADELLYESKNGGRNKVSPDPASLVSEASEATS